MSNKAQAADVRQFIQEARLAQEPGDLENIDAVLQVSVSANKKLYKDVREEDDEMCQALEELMQDKMEERETEKTVKYLKSVMKNMKCTADQAMKTMGIPTKERARYTTLL